MTPATKTRKQRRMERKQVLILVVVLLVVSLASFTLGVMVGSRGAERDLAQKQLVAKQILAARPPVRVAPSTPAAKVGPPVAEPAEIPPQEEQTELSFYDNLAKETAPLGSGINLPPQKEKPKPKPVVKPPIPLPEQPIVKKNLVAVAVIPAKGAQPPAPKEPAVQPRIKPNGKYALQVGSFSAAADAGRLKKRLVDKGYPAFIVEADLAAKGIWYRVKIGPYADSGAAKAMQLLMEKQEQLKGFVSRL